MCSHPLSSKQQIPGVVQQQLLRCSLVHEAAVEDVCKVAAALEQWHAAQLVVAADEVHHQVVRLRGGLLKPVQRPCTTSTMLDAVVCSTSSMYYGCPQALPNAACSAAFGNPQGLSKPHQHCVHTERYIQSSGCARDGAEDAPFPCVKGTTLCL